LTADHEAFFTADGCGGALVGNVGLSGRNISVTGNSSCECKEHIAVKPWTEFVVSQAPHPQDPASEGSSITAAGADCPAMACIMMA
jgi:hypothetical protein